MKVIVATKNPGKIEGVRKAFSHYYEDLEIIGISVNSDVSDQPLNEQIMIGAKNRIENLKKHCEENKILADLFVSIESGITNSLGEWLIINVAVIEDNDNFRSWGTSNGFPVPSKYVDEVINTSLGDVMDKIFDENNLGSGKGGISLLTRDVVSRIDLTEKAFIMALTPFLNVKTWSDKTQS